MNKQKVRLILNLLKKMPDQSYQSYSTNIAGHILLAAQLIFSNRPGVRSSILLFIICGEPNDQSYVHTSMCVQTNLSLRQYGLQLLTKFYADHQLH